MTTVEARVVNPVDRSAVDGVNVTESELDVSLENEEEQLLDEEISSTEGMDLESQMLTVALVKSVVDSTGEKKDGSPSRYGLRKRRRPGDGGSTEHLTSLSLEHNEQAPTMTSSVESHTILSEANNASSSRRPSHITIPPIMKKSETTTETVSRQHPLTIKEEAGPSKGIKIEDHPILGKLQANVTLGVTRPTIPSSSSAAFAPKPAVAKRKVKRPVKAKTSPVKQELVLTSGAVPNPLSRASVTPPPSISQPYVHSQGGSSEPKSVTSSVPCPLPPAVPCPLPAESSEPVAIEKKKVTILEPPVPRTRIFSVDLDPSTFDFSDITGDHNVHERSDSVDIHVSDTSDFPIFQRDRAFSFDFFNFTGDELLPSMNTSSDLSHPGHQSILGDVTPLPRARGDSIIFDPVSFQDGGIHEKNALAKARGANSATPGSEPPSSMPAPARTQPPVTVAPSPLTPYSQAPRDPTSTGQIATLPSSLSNNSPSNANASPATFQMELLNKDGRIGIYLPEARKARIARFHAKRKMRIWRKRIKYDCRKKLADSRPRIKGRFVKRSDMDDE